MAIAQRQDTHPGSKFLIGLLALLIFWVVEQIHLPASFGVKGLNAFNLLAVMAVCVTLVVRRGAPPSPPPPLRGALVLFFLALIWGFAIGQLIDSSQQADDLTIMKTGMFYMGLYFVFFYGVRTVPEIRLLVGVLMAVAMLAGLEAIREAMDYGFAVYSDSKRSAGPFGENYKASNLAAVYFAIFIPLFFSVAFFLNDRPTIRFVALGGTALLVAALFFTYSRQAYAIVAVIALLLALRKNLVVALLVSMALWNYDLWVPDSAVERVQMTEQTDEFGRESYDESTASRWELWAGAAKMLVDRPMGIGLNRFKREVGNYTHYTNLDAHNFYVLITTEAGIPGGVAILVLVIGMLRFAIRNMRLAGTPEARTLAFGFMGATLAMLMGNLYGSRFLNGEVVGNYWVLAALCARYFAIAGEPRTDTTVAITGKLPAGRDQYGRLKRF